MVSEVRDLILEAVCVLADAHEEAALGLREIVQKATDTTPSNLAKYKDILESFPEDLRGLLSFKEEGDTVIVNPRQFLGSENFAKIAAIAKELGGEYHSAGKDSHFSIPK